ncbi:uncharacterized protein LOC132313222 isoform X2 [Cornus florida]|uniref:uncharacterized protein LOC132313222 isoform X2 n=1 Tax=Cornus florida TaxID=4283 RepID=UPI00289D1E65|nr:uncharacterized protein LOC132313222 isoform X2 [Cornus florida]
MGYSFELKGSTKQPQTSKVAKERILPPRAIESLKLQDKCKVERPFGQPYLGWHHELRHSAGDCSNFHPKSSLKNQKQWNGKKVTRDDELVKHMSNLPGYLQQMDRGKNLQEKALNFGVLDWEHLEKWKYDQKHILQKGNLNTSSSSHNSSFMASSFSSLPCKVRGKNLSPLMKQAPLQCARREEDPSQGVKQSGGKVIHLQDFESAPKSTLDGQQKCTKKSFRRNYSEMKIEMDKRKDADQNIMPDKKTSNLRKHGISLSAKDAMSGQNGETKQRVEELQASEFTLAHNHCPGDHQRIVLLLPKHSPKRSCSQVFQPSEGRILSDGKLTQANQKSFSCHNSSEEVHSAELCSEILQSRPLPVSVETNTKPDTEPHSLIKAQGMELPHAASDTWQCSNESPAIFSKSKSVDEKRASMKISCSSPIENSKRFDQETTDPVAAKGRHPSPNHRFSFSLSRMSRSFSFKEVSAVPQLSSSYATVKSGPVTFETSGCLDDSNGKNPNFHSRSRSSPLRRLLDPLLKPKAANRHLSAETVQPLKWNLNSSTSKLIDNSESSPDKKHGKSSVEALLQLTFKNGLPLFKLVVDNNTDILAANVKKLTTTGKGDSTWIYTFYSVNEIKRKSGSWINQRHKGKSGFSYDVVGQMKVSCSDFPDLTAQSTKDHFVVRECVLYGVDIGQTDKVTSEHMPNREVAAIVIKIPSENTKDDGEQSHKGMDLTGTGFTEHLQEDKKFCDDGENERSGSTIVILPGGFHGLPSKGVPSPLINRWKSGGSCDCGGWDVGCKLRILTDQDKSYKHLKQSIPCSTASHLDLFVQGGDQENKPIFSLAPFKKGTYSVEFNTSISLLQAFSICIAFISSQESSDFMEVNNMSEAKLLREPALTGCDRTKPPTIPLRYIPSPPPSPVGRV